MAPTILEAAGLPFPHMVNGVPQVPMDGTSMAYLFDDKEAKERHSSQYFEMFGNRAIYSDGWWARTIHKAPWEAKPRNTLDEDEWELFDTTKDFSLSTNLAAEHPEKLESMKTSFMIEAGRNHVLPIDDRTVERFNSELAGRPDLMAGRTSLTLADGMTGMTENVFLNIKNRSKRITAQVEVPANGGHGTVIAQAGRFGGWSLYVENGIPAYAYNWLGIEMYTVSANEPLTEGTHEIAFDFEYDGGGPGKGGDGTIFVDGIQVAQGRIDQTQAIIFSADETADVGIDLATPVVESIGAEAASRFTGKVTSVTVAVEQSCAIAPPSAWKRSAAGIQVFAFWLPRKPFGDEPVHCLNARRKLFGALYPSIAAICSTGMSEFRSISRACSSMNLERIVLNNVPSAPRAL